MRLFSINELSRYSNATLQAMAARMESILAALPEGSAERLTRLANLRTIRHVLAMRGLSPH